MIKGLVKCIKAMIQAGKDSYREETVSSYVTEELVAESYDMGLSRESKTDRMTLDSIGIGVGLDMSEPKEADFECRILTIAEIDERRNKRAEVEDLGWDMEAELTDNEAEALRVIHIEALNSIIETRDEGVDCLADLGEVRLDILHTMVKKEISRMNSARVMNNITKRGKRI